MLWGFGRGMWGGGLRRGGRISVAFIGRKADKGVLLQQHSSFTTNRNDYFPESF